MFPATAAVEVESPPKESVPVVVMGPPIMGQVVAMLVTVPVPPAAIQSIPVPVELKTCPATPG